MVQVADAGREEGGAPEVPDRGFERAHAGAAAGLRRSRKRRTGGSTSALKTSATRQIASCMTTFACQYSHPSNSPLGSLVPDACVTGPTKVFDGKVEYLALG